MTQGTGWDLPAEQNTIMVYTLMWRELWQRGYTEVRLADQTIKRIDLNYRTGIQSEIVGKQKQNCGGEQPLIQPTTLAQRQPTRVGQLPPSPAPIQSAGPLRSHVATSIGTGVFAKATFSDGQAPYDEDWLWANNHFNIQRIRREEQPDGCGTAQYQANKIWIGVGNVARITVNGAEIGTITAITPLQEHGYIVDVSLNIGDRICATPIPDAGFHILLGPDIYYHHDSYCYRGNC